MGFPLVLVPLEFLTLIVVHAEPLNLSITLQVFVPCHWLPWKRLLMGFVLKSCESLHLPASKFGTSGYESKKSCCFFSLFIFLLFFKSLNILMEIEEKGEVINSTCGNAPKSL